MTELDAINLKLIEAALQADPNVKEVEMQDDQVTFLTRDAVSDDYGDPTYDQVDGVSEMTLSTITMLKGYIMWNECPGCENEGAVTLA